MREYIIRTKAGEEFDIPLAKWKDVFRPTTFDSNVIEGWGAVRLKVHDCEISFSPEPPGMQIIFECDDIDESTADLIVSEILSNVERYCGVEGEIVPLQ